jgi:hypothetical protein
MLATPGRDGVREGLLSALGFDASMIAVLVNQGLATLTHSKVRAGGKMIGVFGSPSRIRGLLLSCSNPSIPRQDAPIRYLMSRARGRATAAYRASSLVR